MVEFSPCDKNDGKKKKQKTIKKQGREQGAGKEGYEGLALLLRQSQVRSEVVFEDRRKHRRGHRSTCETPEHRVGRRFVGAFPTFLRWPTFLLVNVFTLVDYHALVDSFAVLRGSDAAAVEEREKEDLLSVVAEREN